MFATVLQKANVYWKPACILLPAKQSGNVIRYISQRPPASGHTVTELIQKHQKIECDSNKKVGISNYILKDCL